MSNQWPDAIEGRIPTKNQYGFMFLEINGASPEFLQYVKTCTDEVVDLGSAYGIVTLAALKNSNCRVVAFDLSKEHLEILRKSVPSENATRLQTIPGRFPSDFQFLDNSLDAIHSSYMFHFLNGKDTEEGLRKCFTALKPGGKIYINTVSVYLKPLVGALKLYEQNVAKGYKWPGEIYDLKQYLPEQDIAHAPDFLHTHKVEEFEKLLLATGFKINKIFYYDVHEPEWFASEGKGLIGAIATK